MTEQNNLTEEQQKLLFDEELNEFFRTAAHRAFLKVPELRSVVVIYDYFKDLNDISGISKGLWLHTDGGKEKPADSVVGSTGATIQALAHMLDEQMQLYAKLSNQVMLVSKELAEKTKALNAARTE